MRGIKVLPALGEKNLAKIWLKTTKNPQWSLAKSERERKVWKSVLNESNIVFKKNLIHDLRLIEKQVRSIEPSRGSLKFLNAISIDWKIDSIDRNCKKMNFGKSIEFEATSPQSIEEIKKKKMHEYEMKWFSQTQDLKPNSPRI